MARIQGVPSEALKTYATLSIRLYDDEVLLTMEQKRGYLTPKIIVKKSELLEVLRKG